MLAVFSFFSVALAADIALPTGMPTSPDAWGFLATRVIPWVIRLFFLTAFVSAFIFLLWGGISWIMAGGNKESLEMAKRKITYVIVGLVVVLISLVILFTFAYLFGVNLSFYRGF